ncbi:MAG: sialate O-acetylesterase, partial [Opitutaceae bacterium]
ATTAAGVEGAWRVMLDPLDYAPAHAPQTMIVRGATHTVRLSDVLIGEVWVCSGQSNMRFTLGRKAEPRDDQAPLLFSESLANCAQPGLRLLNVSGGTPADRKWAACAPDTAAAFSAIGYFYGAALAQARDVPIGLVDLGRGGAAIRSFIPLEAFNARSEFTRAYPPEQRPGATTGAVFAKDVQPFAPFAVRGVLWYQGEGDAARAALYSEMLRVLIAEWRRAFETPELPFVVVQLPPWERRRTDPPRTSIGIKWAELRAAQAEVANADPHLALVVIADCGERLDIHPRRKREVGERLARVIRAEVYGETITRHGPELISTDVRPDVIVLTFAHTEGGLFARGGQLDDLEVAGEDGKFVAATATVTGHNQITVQRPPGGAATFVRYAWRDYFEPSLFNGDGWPAAPFRTDAFPFTTAVAGETARDPGRP